MRVLKFVWKVVSTFIVALAVAAAVFLVGLRVIAGFHPFSVHSGSMEPVYSVGTLVYVEKCSLDEIKPGDDVTFTVNEELDVATHRVASVNIEDGSFVTYGLANKDENGDPILDGEMDGRNIVGKVRFSIPYLGYVSDFVTNPPGSYITAVVLITLLVLSIIFDKNKGDNKDATVL